MHSLISLELRWCVAGKPSDKLFEWFRGSLPGPDLDEAERRQDVYLYQPQYDNFEMALRRKKREAAYSLEIKWHAETKPFDGPHRTAGQVERWHRWGWDNRERPGQKQISAFGLPRGPWLTVSKQQWQRKYRWTGNGFLLVSSNQVPEVGATVEITSLKCQRDPYTTVLIEAFSPDTRQQGKVLQRAVEDLWVDYPERLPRRDQSYGYSSWLRRYQYLLGTDALPVKNTYPRRIETPATSTR